MKPVDMGRIIDAVARGLCLTCSGEGWECFPEDGVVSCPGEHCETCDEASTTHVEEGSS